jgi:site-specific DNA-methyltransferase (adenine-specific)
MVCRYYEDELVTLYLGNCHEIAEWTAADVLVTDPPYGIGWRTNGGGGNGITPGRRHDGIQGDNDTSTRDRAMDLWGAKPALVFGSFRAPPPAGVVETLVYRKPADSGVLGTTTGWRRDVEPVYVLGTWPRRKTRWSAVVAARGGICNAIMRTGHPHTKPLDVMEQLVEACPEGVIADPFAGSGSTLVAARNLGRRAVGVELEERYCEVVAKRLDQGVLPLMS